jgi:hypothetical protein
MTPMQAVDVKAIKRWMRANVPFEVEVNRYRKYQVCVSAQRRDLAPYADALIAALGLERVTKVSVVPGRITSLDIVGKA